MTSHFKAIIIFKSLYFPWPPFLGHNSFQEIIFPLTPFLRPQLLSRGYLPLASILLYLLFIGSWFPYGIATKCPST